MSEPLPRLQKVAQDLAGLLGLAKEFVEQKRFDEAVAHAEQALYLDPKCAQAHLLIARVDVTTGRWEAAEQRSRQALEIDSELAEAHLLAGRIALEARDYARAERCSRRALDIDSKLAMAHAILGFACREQGRLREAIGHVKRATRLAPDKPEYFFLLGDLYEEAQEHSAALRAFQRVVELRSAVPHAHYRLGCILLAQNRLEEAGAAFDAATRLNPVDSLTDFFRALFCVRNGKYDLARELLTALHDRLPRFTLARVALGDVDLRQESYLAALEHFQQALAEDPALAAAYQKRGTARRRLGQPLDAVADLREAMRRDPRLATARLELEDVYQELKATGLVYMDIL